MTLGNESKGHEWTFKVGPSGSEETYNCTGFSMSVNNNLESLYSGGSRTPISIKEGNIEITGSFTRPVQNDRFIGEVLALTSTINFVGINNGSSTHIARYKKDTDSNTKLAPASWSGSEFSNGEYDGIEADDASEYSLTENASTNNFPAVLLKFDNIGTEANIDFVKFEIVAYGTGATNGFTVWAYDFDNTQWVQVGTSTAAAAYGSVSTVLSSPGPFIDGNSDIYFMVRPSVAYDGATASVLHVDYVDLTVHDTTGRNLQEGQSVQVLGSNATGSITLTLASCKFGEWSYEFSNDGSTIFETITYIATSLTRAQT